MNQPPASDSSVPDTSLSSAPIRGIRWKSLAPYAIAMGLLIAAANFLVFFPLGDLLTWAALIYPLTFLVLDLANRTHGAHFAAQVMACGFAIGLPLSLWLAETRIALASLTAYLCGQTLDILIFDRLRNAGWWKAPLFSSLVAATTDSVLFFTLAFAYSGADWLLWCVGDTGVKLLIVVAGLPLYRSISLRLSSVQSPVKSPAKSPVKSEAQ